MTNLFSDSMPFLNSKFWTYSDIQLGVKSVAQPPYPDISDPANPLDVIDRMVDFINDFGIYAIEQTGENRLAGLPDDLHDCCRNKKTNDRIRQWIAQPDPDHAQKHSQTGEAVYPGVLTVGDESGTADLFANLDAKLCYRLVTEETDYRGYDYGPEMFHGLREEEAIHRFVTSDNSTNQNSQYDG